jgi:hypothetical protein
MTLRVKISARAPRNSDVRALGGRTIDRARREQLRTTLRKALHCCPSSPESEASTPVFGPDKSGTCT